VASGTRGPLINEVMVMGGSDRRPAYCGVDLAQYVPS
jgi:hypothetical protein